MNIDDFVFAGSVQYLRLSTNTFWDKLNLVVMFFILFAVVFYVLCFYGLVYARESRKSSENLIVYSKNRMKSYFFEPVLFLVRSVVKSFVHGYLINSYATQIVILFLTDVVFLVICLTLYRNFRNKFVSTLTTLYFLVFMLFDLYFVI
jgi:hypothetical protein